MKHDPLFHVSGSVNLIGNLIRHRQVVGIKILKKSELSHQAIKDLPSDNKLLPHFQRAQDHILSLLFLSAAGETAEILKEGEAICANPFWIGKPSAKFSSVYIAWHVFSFSSNSFMSSVLHFMGKRKR